MTPVAPRGRLRWLRGLLTPLARPRETAAVLLLVGGAVGIEILGRRYVSDVGDGGMLFAALGLVFLAGGLCPDRWEAFLARLRAGRGDLAERLRQAWPQIGVDFRDDPTIPHCVPRVVRRFTLGLMLVTAALITWNVGSETSLRALLAPRVYLVHLLLLALLWVGLVLSILFGLVAAWLAGRHLRWITGRLRDGLRGRGALWCGAVGAAAFFLPVELALLLGFSAIAGILAMPRLAQVPRLTLLWRTPGDGNLAATTWTAAIWQTSALPMATTVLFVALALGGVWSWLPTPPSSTPITDVLARIAMWCVGSGFIVLTGVLLRDLRRMAASNPARPCPMSLHVTEQTTVDSRATFARLVAARGWHIRYAPEPEEPTDVRLRLVDSPMPRPPRGWPLPVSTRALEVPALLDLIERRDVVQRRRLFRRGMERLLKDLTRREYERGGGFWIAPHLWFVSAVSRDTEENDLPDEGVNGELGPPYATLFPLPVRHHLYTVLRAVEVDILLLEDGVRWPGLRRVFDRIFTHFDEGRGRIEERDFPGMPRIRVVLHELEPGGTLGVAGYPEPDYTDLARGRILHVFRDRGGFEEADEPVPAEDTRIPVHV